VCHGKTPGDLQSFQVRKLPRDLVAQGITNPPLAAHATGWLKAAYNSYASKPENAMAVMALKAGNDPETGAKLCDIPIYGCAVHALPKKNPSNDLTAPLLALGAMVLGGIVRRRRRS